MLRLLDVVTHYLANRKGLLPLLGMALVLLNLIVRLAAPASWLGQTDLLLHVGLLLAVFGLLLARVL